MRQKAKQMSTKKKHVKCCSNILNVTMQREWTCSAWVWTTGRRKNVIGFSPAIRWMLSLSSQKAVAQDCLKSENILMVCLQTAGLKRETGRQLHTDPQCAATAESLVMHTTWAFTFIDVSKWHLFRIPASKRICMNVGVFQNIARRKKST